MSEAERRVIANQIVGELRASIETLQTLSSVGDVEIIWDLIWRGFARAELAVGIASFVFEENLAYLAPNESPKKIREKKFDVTNSDMLRENLRQICKILELSNESFERTQFILGLEQARQGRDKLKALLIEKRRIDLKKFSKKIGG